MTNPAATAVKPAAPPATTPLPDAFVQHATPERQRFTAVFKQLKLDDRAVNRSTHASMRPPPLDGGTRDELYVATLPHLTRSEDDKRPPELAITTTIGEGGMGVIRRARQLSLGRDVAVKTLKPEHRNTEAVAKLLREALVTGSLEHPNIIPVHALGRDEAGGPLLAMKLVEGVPWTDVIRDADHPIRQADGRDHLSFHIAVLESVCRAIQYAHSKQIIHRDLKPDNVMIGKFGEVYVLDWGIAVSLVDDGTGTLPLASDSQGAAGSPAYMAPEMIQDGAGDLNEQTDVYLLGGLLHEILTGTPRHVGESVFTVLYAAWTSAPHTYADDVPHGLAQICNRAMSREAHSRHESAEELRTDLLEYLEHRSSAQISAAAAGELAELREIAKTCERVDDTTIRHMYALHSSVASGFRQARAIWPENDQAIDGLHDCNRIAADCALRIEDHKTAALLISELERPEPALSQRLVALETQLAAASADVERLRELERSMDLSVGSRARSMVALFMGILWTGMPALGAYGQAHWGYEVSYDDQFISTGLFGGFVGLLTWYWRKELLHSRINRMINRALWISVLGSAALRLVGAWLVMPPNHISITLMIVFALIVAMLAVSVDMRLMWSALTYLIAGMAASLAPEWTLELLAVSNLAVFGTIAWVWSPATHACSLLPDPNALAQPSIA